MDGRTLVVVLHDLNQAARYASQIVAMRDGRIVADGTPDEVIVPDLVEEVFPARRRLLRDRIRSRFAEHLGPQPTLAEKVRELAVVQDESGYLCRAEMPFSNGGAIELREHNCAILGAAAGHPAACRAELQLFEEVLEARVVRTTHIASGDRCCTYRIEPLEA